MKRKKRQMLPMTPDNEENGKSYFTQAKEYILRK
jgi:hypothetical protein